MLEVKNVTAGYGNQIVLDGVNANFEKGKLTSIIGVNGCGKSTLLKTLINILPLFDGKIEVDGKDILSMRRNDIAKKISYLAQGKNTPDMTVMQMVMHGRFPYLNYPRRYTNRDREIAYTAMVKLGISDLAHKPLCELSGGMRQNAYIAMALAQDTDYILLDEPTAYLDISHQLNLMRILRELADSGKGIVAVMHDLPLAFDFSDKLAIINSGSIVAQKTPSEISVSGVVEDIFGVRIKNTQENKYSYQYL